MCFSYWLYPVESICQRLPGAFFVGDDMQVLSKGRCRAAFG